jgi:MFS family permease
MAVPRAARPFLVGQYRILVGALLLSLLGAGVWLVATVFQVKELGGGPIDLSYVATANAVGLLLAVLVGGAIADRIPQKRILLAVEATKTVFIAATAVLALSGVIEIWQLAIVGFVLGIADGFFYPAYSALLPSILPADQLLAANGVEGMLRPAIMQALGPLLASVVIAIYSPAMAFVVVGIAQLLAVLGLAWLRTTPIRRELDDAHRHPIAAMFTDIKDGFVYMVHTPWLLATLLYATLLILVIMGPIEVLLPFVVTDTTGGGAAAFALVLAAFGLGGAIASLIVASLRLPRRYLTVMNLCWGVGSVPLIVVGFTGQLWAFALALFLVGFGYSAGTVIWGTLLQRRVPPAMLGRVSSLDFFVSLAFMPISMAVAGPVGEAIGYGWTFLIVGAVPVVLAVGAILIARMPRDELEHPLDIEPTDADTGDERAGVAESSGEPERA